MTEDIHKSNILRALRNVLTWIPHRPYCARTLLRTRSCTCDVDDRSAIAYSVVASLLLDLRKGER